MKNVNFELENYVQYSNGSGTEIEGSFIELSEPTGKIAHLVGILKSEIGAATKNSMSGLDESLTDAITQQQEVIKETQQEETDPAEDGNSVFQILLMGGANMERVFVTFKEILKITSLVGGEKQMTLPMIDRLSYSDLEGCLKAYIGNFLKAS